MKSIGHDYPVIGNILLTGAGGLVGSAVRRKLNKKNISYIGLYRKIINAQEDHPEKKVEVDLGKNNSLQALVNKGDIIIHCAAAIPTANCSFEECYLRNKIIDNHIFTLAKQKKIKKLIFISTTNLYGTSDKIISEDSELKIDNLYAQGKFESEKMFYGLRENGIEVILLRINAPYHFTGYLNTVLKIFIEKALNDLDIVYHGTGSRQQDFTHADDVAEAVIACIFSDKSDVYNISSGTPISMKSLAEMICQLVPTFKGEVRSAGIPDQQENNKAIFEIRKAKRELNWSPRICIKEGVEEWIKNKQK